MVDHKLSGRQIIKQIIPNVLIYPNIKPSEFIKKYWALYLESFTSNNNLNGKVFEEIIAITLIREKIFPFYMQARVAFIPNVNYDIIIYTKNIGPISISAKTSLRERYKQADLEAVALKYIHREAKNFLVSLDKIALDNLKKHPRSVMGIDELILATGPEYNNMIKFLHKNTVSQAPKIEVVTSNIFITEQNYMKYY